MHHLHRLLPLALLLLAPAASPAEGPITPRIVNGLPTSGLPSTGALLRGSDAGSATTQCSGTLIGCSTFLTAAHCVCDGTGSTCQGAGAPDPAVHFVFLQHAGVFPVRRIAVHPDFDFPVADFAIVELAAPVSGIAPMRPNGVVDPPLGIPGTIVGFGRGGGGSGDYGLKRQGRVVTSSCPFSVSPVTSVCWTFEAPIGPPGEDSNTCNGDSGGPLLLDFGPGPLLAGVTSGGTSSSCLATDQSYDADVFHYRAWLAGQVGDELAAPRCGSGPQAEEPGAQPLAFSGSLSASLPEGRHVLTVAPNTARLRVALNASEEGGARFDLYVKRGSPPTRNDFDCAAAGSSQYGFCSFESPASGTWHVLVDRLAGSAPYQVTATAFGAGGLRVDLASRSLRTFAGEPFPLTLSLANAGATPQPFALVLLLAPPGASAVTVIPPTTLGLPAGTQVAPELSLPIPAGGPSGVWSATAVVFTEAGLADLAQLLFRVD